jgi:putative copper resistance protein D
MGAADFGLLAARALSYGALLLAAGLPIYLLTTARALSNRSRLVLALLALIAMAASVWLALASVATMAAMELGQLDRELVTAVLSATPLGMVLTIRLVALFLLMLALLAAPARWRLWLAALAGSAALVGGVLTGHAGATADSLGTLHRFADGAHLLAAATWLAALTVFIASLLRKAPADRLAMDLAGFASTGTLIVVVLTITGVINTVAITGWPVPPAIYGSGWTGLLAAKLALFAAMLGFAALNRWKLTPALAHGGAAALHRLRLSLGAEAAAGVAIILLISQMGLLDPAG